ncbi:MAG: Crp/Fnr family transcriptional regulator [Clostridia bacterium]|nr:Crp/Fnr family transcriptional regulator [Clostridia bacterium]
MEKTLPVWGDISKNERELLLKNAIDRHFSTGTVMETGEDRCLGLMLILRGELRLYMMSEEGREVTLLRLHSGDLSVISAACVLKRLYMDALIVAEADTEVKMVPLPTLNRLMEENIHLRCYLYELMMQHLSEALGAVEQVVFQPFCRRLSGFLIAECQRTGADTVYLTHEQIAKYLGSAREVVARMMKRFAAAGLVEMRRGSVRVLDADGLLHFEK